MAQVMAAIKSRIEPFKYLFLLSQVERSLGVGCLHTFLHDMTNASVPSMSEDTDAFVFVVHRLHET